MQYQLGDTIITVGTKIRSYDFPHSLDTYMEGTVIKKELDLLLVKTSKVIVDSQPRDLGANNVTFTTPDIGCSCYDDMFPQWERIIILEK